MSFEQMLRDELRHESELAPSSAELLVGTQARIAGDRRRRRAVVGVAAAALGVLGLGTAVLQPWNAADQGMVAVEPPSSGTTTPLPTHGSTGAVVRLAGVSGKLRVTDTGCPYLVVEGVSIGLLWPAGWVAEDAGESGWRFTSTDGKTLLAGSEMGAAGGFSSLPDPCGVGEAAFEIDSVTPPDSQLAP